MWDENLYVNMWEEEVEIPTYLVGEADKNPMFLEKRVYQGSSGKVYPHPVIDKIYDEKVNKKYKVVFLENKYLKIMIMPELGGRIQRALDKTNNYDFVYYNKVIKPALVGLAGPWISGGIEFNWPQHHRPNTFGPVDYTLEENKDGSKTLWVSEIDRMYGTKGMAGFTLYPDKAYLEIKGQLYNGTSQPQTFLWWANPAVPVNDYTQSVFPPDVHAVFDHGKRDVSKFPIATGVYYKMDYSAGVDISRYKNIPVPTSYMAYKSDFNFVGGYDHSVNAGILHVANHHISPGKKQWTWGCGDFGKAWDRNLTDADGPYIELMTGVYTDNQPDFTWLQPYEEKSFKQYFMPYKNIGVVKSANINAAVSLEVEDDTIKIGAYTTAEYRNANIIVKGKYNEYLNENLDLKPEIAFNREIIVDSREEEHYINILLLDSEGKEVVSYKPEEKKVEKIPDAAKAIGSPESLKNNEALYLAGIHLEQYRHATYEPEEYYLEGLARDPEDLRINNAYGNLLFRRGQFAKAEECFKTAVKTSTRHNPNPYDGEVYYNLGLSLRYQGKLKEAYAAFYKATWNGAWQDSGYFEIAQIDCINGDLNLALEHINKSIVRNYHNCKSRNLKSAILRKLNRLEEAEKFAEETQCIDKLDFGSKNELYLIALKRGVNSTAGVLLSDLNVLMRQDSHNYLYLAQTYGSAGLYKEATDVLMRVVNRAENKNSVYPMIYYYAAFYNLKVNDRKSAEELFINARNAKTDYCFPNSINDIEVLLCAQYNGNDGNSFYYLGNLWYDKKQYDLAVKCWEKSVEINPNFPTTYRNLALAYYNKMEDETKAREALEKAFNLNKKDARVFLELDQLYKKLNIPYTERLEAFEENLDLVKLRDDLFIEYVTLINLTGNNEKALSLISNRIFHPWEGGEGKVTKQYVYAHEEIAKKLIAQNKFEEAITHLMDALVYPENLGEGKLAGAQDNNINYYLGCAYEALGKNEEARDFFIKASVGVDEPASAMFYNDQPPETIFYQGLALSKLGRELEARGRFNKLIDYGEKHLFDHVTIDYFAVSLPDFLIFDDDLTKKNIIHCHYLIGLGNIGIKNFKKAKESLEHALEMDVNNQGIRIHLNIINQK